MIVNAESDNGPVKFDPAKVRNFCHHGLHQTDIEHYTDGELVTVRVNHSMLQIAQVIAACKEATADIGAGSVD